MPRLIAFTFFTFVFSFSFVEPHYSAVFDTRYMQAQTNGASGVFRLADFELSTKFSLDPHHQLTYETRLSSTNIEWARQFFLDIDPLWMPGSLRLGRFNIPFGQQEHALWQRPFIAPRVIHDAFISSVPFIPKTETGLGYFFHTRPFSVDIYLTNANGGTAKTLGGDCRFLIRDLLDAGFSMSLADGLFLGGTDYHVPLASFDFSVDFQWVSGKVSGVSLEGNAASTQLIYSFSPALTVGGQYSAFNHNGVSQSTRSILNSTLLLGYDMKVRLEYMIDRLQGVNDNVLQAQCQVAL